MVDDYDFKVIIINNTEYLVSSVNDLPSTTLVAVASLAACEELDEERKRKPVTDREGDHPL